MDVEHEAIYVFGAQQRLGEAQRHRIVRAQDLFHVPDVPRPNRSVESVARPRPERHVTTPITRLQELLEAKMNAVNALIATRMASENAPRIPEVTAHLIGAGGKRVRPLLTLAAAGLYDYRGDHDEKLAATVEFIHTATLLHDDVVDESQQRRGRPTANLLWDNQSSVLVGDYLFARSFQLMVEADSLRVMAILANAAAVIAEGEVLQLSVARNLDTPEATYIKVVRGKTAALFAAATEVGALVAGAPEEQIDALRTYGDALGIAFQIADDLLDLIGTDIGKNNGDDLREGKLTLPVIRAIARADAGERIFWERLIGKGRYEDGDLDTALTIFARHGILDTVRDTAFDHAGRAQAALDIVPAGPIRQAMHDLAEFVVSRLR